MSTLTLTADSVRSQVRVDADFSDIVCDGLAITRTRVDTGATALLRPTGPYLPVTALYQQLNSNGDFETNITNWSALGSMALAQSSTQAHRGTFSMRMTTPAGTGPGAESEKETVIPGQAYAVTAWLYSPVVTCPTVGINWYNAANTLIGTTVGTVAQAATIGWNLLQVAAPAPAGAAKATIVAQYAAGLTPGTGIVYYLDEGRLCALTSGSGQALLYAVNGQLTGYDVEMPLDTFVTYSAAGYVVNGSWAVQLVTTPVTAGPVQVTSNGFCWLKDPTAPGNSVPLTTSRRVSAGGLPFFLAGRGLGFLGIGDETRKAMSSALDVNNQSKPIAVSKRRRSAEGTLGVAAHSFADRDALKMLLSAGGPILFQAPAQYGVADRYLQVSDETVGRIGQDMRMAARLFALPYVVVDAPVGPAQGVTGSRWQDLCNHYASWGLLEASGGGALDLFARTVGAGGMGSADVGGAYTVVSGTASDVSVTGGAGLISMSAVAANYRVVLTSEAVLNGELVATYSVPVVALGSYIELGAVLRYTNANNHYTAGVRLQPGGGVVAFVSKTVAGVTSDVATGTVTGLAYAANSKIRILVAYTGTAPGTFSVKAWLDATQEPAAFTISPTDSALTAAGGVGHHAMLNTGNTNTLPVVASITNFRLVTAITWTQIMGGAVG